MALLELSFPQGRGSPRLLRLQPPIGPNAPDAGQVSHSQLLSASQHPSPACPGKQYRFCPLETAEEPGTGGQCLPMIRKLPLVWSTWPGPGQPGMGGAGARPSLLLSILALCIYPFRNSLLPNAMWHLEVPSLRAGQVATWPSRQVEGKGEK